MDDEESARRREKTKKKGRDGRGWARDASSPGEGPRDNRGYQTGPRFRDRDMYMYIVRERQ